MNSYSKYLDKVGEASKTVSLVNLKEDITLKHQETNGADQTRINQTSNFNARCQENEIFILSLMTWNSKSS